MKGYKSQLMTTVFALGFAGAAATASAAVGDPVDLQTWDRSGLAQGWSSEELLDEEVFGPNGDDIGEVEDIVIGADGRVKAVIVETEAFLDIGDVHALVDWSKVSAGPEEDSIQVPVTQETLEEFRTNYDDDNLGNRSYRVRELIGDGVRLTDGSGYGRIDDIIFSADGKASAVIVAADYGYDYGVGPYAYPYHGYGAGWQPGMGYYDLPYTRDQVAANTPTEREWDGPFD